MSANFGSNLSHHHVSVRWLDTAKGTRFKRTSTGTNCVASELIIDWLGIEAKAQAK